MIFGLAYPPLLLVSPFIFARFIISCSLMSDAFPLIRKQIQLLKKINYEEFMESYKNSIYKP